MFAPVRLLHGLILALAITGCSKPEKPEKVVSEIPKMTDPIEVVDGDFYLDGGSVSVTLQDSEGTVLPVVFSTSFEDENFQSDSLYIGTMDELYDGEASLCLMDSQAAIDLAEYLEQAVKIADPSFDPDEEGYLNKASGDKSQEPRKLSAARGILQYLRENVPANLIYVECKE